jgi:hypothetical protein
MVNSSSLQFITLAGILKLVAHTHTHTLFLTYLCCYAFAGVNVHVQSGSGTTAGIINGKGNLVVGYNEDSGLGTKDGSHNLVSEG